MSKRNLNPKRIIPILSQRKQFPVEMLCEKQAIFHKDIGMYDQWIVAANGIVIAHFVDDTSAMTYLNNYIKQYGFSTFPKVITDAMQRQYENGVIKKEV